TVFTHRVGNAGQAITAVAVVLVQHRNTLRIHAGNLYEVMHQGSSFLRITGAVVKNVAIRRIIAQQLGTRESTEQQKFIVENGGQDRLGGWRTHIADQRERAALWV